MIKMIPRYSRLFLGLILLATSQAFQPTPFSRHRHRETRLAYYLDDTAFTVDRGEAPPTLKKQASGKMKVNKATRPQVDPANVEFVSSSDAYAEMDGNVKSYSDLAYPFAMMLQGSARYIADHAGEIAVFHIPGDLIETAGFPNLVDDISLAWLLGMKIVIVVGCRSDKDGCLYDFEHAHECHNSLRVTDENTMRQVEEEAGFVRFELERRLNKCLRRHCGVMVDSKDAPASNGNVVGGNFYTAQPFGLIRGEDYKHTGYTAKVHVENIKKALDNNDVVLLTTISSSRTGELVNVNGNHLAATVAKSLEAHKVIYLSNYGKVLRYKGENKSLQDISLSEAQSVLDHYQVQVHKSGFAAFENARQTLEPGAVELLLHLGWACYAVEQGVTRAHVVNPGDGALLEELFTAKHGANTCVFHDDELLEDTEDSMFESDLDSFLAAAANQRVRAT